MVKDELTKRGQASPKALEGVTIARELFWQNVMREILTSLSVISSMGEQPADLFDGRLAVITQLGQRVPIAGVMPLFACGIDTSDTERELSLAVECTVFQIRTPGGEVFTLPLHEMRSFHSLSEELIERIRKESAERQDESEEHEPFGFAAYTSLARTKLPGDDPGTTLFEGPEASPD
ncbi:MAG TPA: hypothetical protein VD997_06715 [Phycisphaerales bacterium]|nr:hypothetical protein [Phycisphaerales bacterium]